MTSPPLPSATATWHNSSYAAITPSRPELTARGKTVIVTGAGSGIGRATAIAFSDAGASRLILLGRTESSLKETAGQLNSGVEAVIHVIDITDNNSMHSIATSTGSWDILVLAAGYVSLPSSIAGADGAEWWQSFETNVKGTLLAIQALLPTARGSGAAILGVTTGPAANPAAKLPNLSAYITSKLAQIRLLEYVAAEHPHIFVASVHPGMVPSAIFYKSGAEAARLPIDDARLPAHFMVWLASPEGAFLRGRVVWANWDVEQLKQQAPELQRNSAWLTSGIYGWPVSPPSTSSGCAS